MTLNFPSNPADGDKYPYTDPITNTTTIYTWRKDANLWTAQVEDVVPDVDGPPHEEGTLDDRYVEKSGDDMTGDLTLGTDKITLDASGGTITTSGDIKVGERDPAAIDKRGVRIAVDAQNGGCYVQSKIASDSLWAFQALAGKDEKFKVTYAGNITASSLSFPGAPTTIDFGNSTTLHETMLKTESNATNCESCNVLFMECGKET